MLSFIIKSQLDSDANIEVGNKNKLKNVHIGKNLETKSKWVKAFIFGVATSVVGSIIIMIADYLKEFYDLCILW